MFNIQVAFECKEFKYVLCSFSGNGKFETQLKTIQNDLTRLQIHYDELNDRLLNHKQFLGLKQSVNEAGTYLNQQEQYVNQLAKSEVDEDSVIKQTENIEKAVNEIKWREIESTLANLIQVC